MTELEKQLAYLRPPKENLNQINKLKKKLEMAQLAERVLGHRIRCDYMYDVFDSTGKIDEAARRMKGVCGTVESVDDACQLHVKWDNGSSLALNPDVDEFVILEVKDSESRQHNYQSTARIDNALDEINDALEDE